MGLKDNWKDVGKGLGKSFAGLGKSIVKSVKEGANRATGDEPLDENGNPVINEKTGEEKMSRTKILPGYVLVKMTMTDESWHVVRNITGVTGFVGPGSEPTPLTDEEIEAMQIEHTTNEFKFKLGDKVKVVSGMFEGYFGTILEISDDQKSLVILANTGKRDISIMVETKEVDFFD